LNADFGKRASDALALHEEQSSCRKLTYLVDNQLLPQIPILNTVACSSDRKAKSD
jgi:hypothetical protein